jgi:hypothetical protein
MFLIALSHVLSRNLTYGFHHAKFDSDTDYSFNIPLSAEAYIMTFKQLDQRMSVTLTSDSITKQISPSSSYKFRNFKINTSQFRLNIPDSSDAQIWVIEAGLCSSVEYSWDIQFTSNLDISFHNQLCLFLPFLLHQDPTIHLSSSSNVRIIDSTSFQEGTDFTLHSPFFVYLNESGNDSFCLEIESDSYGHAIGSCGFQAYSYFDFDKGFLFESDSTQIDMLSKECSLSDLPAWSIALIVVGSVVLIFLISAVFCCCCGCFGCCAFCGCCNCCPCRCFKKEKAVVYEHHYYAPISNQSSPQSHYAVIPSVIYPSY